MNCSKLTQNFWCCALCCFLFLGLWLSLCPYTTCQHSYQLSINIQTHQCARKKEGIDNFVLFKKRSGCVDEQALEEVILDVHQTLIQLLRLVSNVNRSRNSKTFWNPCACNLWGVARKKLSWSPPLPSEKGDSNLRSKAVGKRENIERK